MGQSIQEKADIHEREYSRDKYSPGDLVDKEEYSLSSEGFNSNIQETGYSEDM